MEVGIILTDAWQQRGLGGKMLCRLAVEARRHAVKAFSAIALWENQRVLRLARRTFPAVRIACASGSCELTLDLEPVSEVEQLPQQDGEGCSRVEQLEHQVGPAPLDEDHVTLECPIALPAFPKGAQEGSKSARLPAFDPIFDPSADNQ
jgi:hypothetical protein